MRKINGSNIFFGEWDCEWLGVRGGECGDFVFGGGEGDGLGKMGGGWGGGEVGGEGEGVIWVKGGGVGWGEVMKWEEEEEGGWLVIRGIGGVGGGDVCGGDLVKGWG